MKQTVWWQTKMFLGLAILDQAPRCTFGGVAQRKTPLGRAIWKATKTMRELAQAFSMIEGEDD